MIPFRIIILLAVAACIVSPASAYIYSLAQGDTAYIGDTVDVSLVVAWPDYHLAWCSDGEPGCGSPMVWDFTNENMHRVVLTPERFRTGNYYRWDGEWHPAENSFAFRIVPGQRPSTETIIEVANITITESDITLPAVNYPNSTHIVIARGDTVTFTYVNSNLSETSANIWLFGMESTMRYEGVYGHAMAYRSNDSVFIYEINQSLSKTLTEGQYAGYIQFAGENDMQDVFLRESHKVDDDRYDVLDTLYDDDIIQDVPIDGFVSSRVKEEFEILHLGYPEYNDDVIIPVSMSVETPALYFTEYYEQGNSLIISGTTTIDAGTTIMFRLDPDRYILTEDIKTHTWYSVTEGEFDSVRTFNVTIPIDWNETAVGEHTILATIDKYGIHTESTKNWKVTDTFIMPTPTPIRERVIVEDYGWHRVPTTLPTPVPEINVTLSGTWNSTELVSSQNQTIGNMSYTNESVLNQTTTQPTVTIVTTTAIPVPKNTIPTIPISPLIGIAAIGMLIFLWNRLRD